MKRYASADTPEKIGKDAGEIAGFTLFVNATGSDGSALQISPVGAQQNVTIGLEAPPSPITPVAGGTGVDTTTTFTFAEMKSSVSVVHFIPQTSGQPNIYVITGDTKAQIPDLSSVGLSLPKGASYKWQILGMGGFTDSDSTTGSDGVFDVAEYNVSRLKRLGTWRNYGIASSRAFTTAN